MRFEPHHHKTCSRVFSTRSDANWAVQPQNMTKCLRSRGIVLCVAKRSFSELLISHMQKAGFLLTRLFLSVLTQSQYVITLNIVPSLGINAYFSFC